MRAAAFLASLLAPPRCAACGAGTRWHEALCARCRMLLGSTVAPPCPAPRDLDASWAAAPYEGVAAELVVALKFRGLLALAETIAARIAEGVPAQFLRGSLVPVPPSPSRLRRRGFDPAELIAAELSRLTALPVAACLRRADGPRQVGRPRAERIGSPPAVSVGVSAPSSAVLVDDVQTTGATLSACARALRGAGAARVVAVTFARTQGVRPAALAAASPTDV